jgi:hypothetical protein
MLIEKCNDLERDVKASMMHSVTHPSSMSYDIVHNFCLMLHLYNLKYFGGPCEFYYHKSKLPRFVWQISWFHKHPFHL